MKQLYGIAGVLIHGRVGSRETIIRDVFTIVSKGDEHGSETRYDTDSTESLSIIIYDRERLVIFSKIYRFLSVRVYGLV